MGFVESRDWRRAAFLLDLLDLLDAGQEVGDRENVGQLPRDKPFILGAEISQGIQYHRASKHLTNADDRGPDNSVDLTAGKPAWVRVYVRSGFFTAEGTPVTGRIDIERRRPGGAFEHLPGVGPAGLGVVGVQRRPPYADERGTLASTLNFVLRAATMSGTLRLTITIWRSDDAAKTPVDSFTISASAMRLRTLALRGIFIAYDGPPSLNPPAGTPNLQLPAPGLADLVSTAARALTLYPVQSAPLPSSAGGLAHPWDTPLTGVQDPPGGCSTQWYKLGALLAAVRANDGNRDDVIYYGLLPAGTPVANVSGCGSSGVGAGRNGDQGTMAHEVGHGAGLRHAPCPSDVGKVDSAYPAYEPYDPPGMPTASIGEYGLNINTGEIHDPTEKDFMSYCGPKWISLYHHNRLLNADRLSPQNVAGEADPNRLLADPFLWPWEYLPDLPPGEDGPADVPVATPLISIIGTVNAAGEVEIASVMRMTALPFLTGTRTDLIAELVGGDGGVVARAPVVRLDSHAAACGCGGEPADEADGPYLFQALLDDVEPGTALHIRRRRPVTRAAEGEETPIWIREAPDRAPLVQQVTAEVDDHAVHLRWSTIADDSERPLTHCVQVTKDEGKSWNGVAVSILGEAVDVSLDGLPTGPVRFRVLAHDGFHTASAVSDPVTIPARPPVVTILHPVDGRPVPGGGSVRLHCAVTSLRGTLDDRTVVEWRIDGEPVDRGWDVFVKTPPPGQHRVELVVEDQDGQVVQGVPLIVTDGDPYVE